MKDNKYLKRFLAFALSVAMIITYMPINLIAYAEGEDSEQPVAETVVDNADSAAPAESTEKAEDPAPQEEVKTEEPAPVQEEAKVAEPEQEEEPEVSEEQSPAEGEQQTVEEQPPGEAAPAEETTEPEEEEKFPAQNFNANKGGVKVVVKAPEGALPEGTEMVVTPANTTAVEQAVKDAVDGEVTGFRAVDITFVKDGKDIEPKIPVQVYLNASGLDKDAEKTVVHISDSGNAEVVDGATVNSAGVAKVVTDQFSVYVVVETGEDARLVVNFVRADGSTAQMMINERQIDHIDQYIFDPGAYAPETQEPEGSIFKGWTNVENYDSKTPAKTIADVREEIKTKLGTDFTDGTEVTYYAMAFKSYEVTYLDELGIVVQIDQVLVKADATETPTHDVTLNYTPYPPDADGVASEFKGWQQVEPEVPGEMRLYTPGQSFALEEENYILRAYTQQGHWLSFDENLSSASYTEPQFVQIGATPTEPSYPTRAGYTFDGWYTEDASSERDGQVSGNPVDFTEQLDANTTVYAKWNKATTADYKVIFWLQNVDGNGYDYEETVTVRNATVGQAANDVTVTGTGDNAVARVNNRNYSYTGFHYNEHDTNVTVAAEGNSIVNVYYNRNSHTFTFQNNNRTIHTVTRLFGQDISDIWSFTGSDGRTYPQTDPPTSWTPSGSSTYTARITRMEVMPDEDIRFTHTTTENTTRYFHYYVETLPGETGTRTYNGSQYSLYTDLVNDFNIVYYNDDFWNLKGFTRQAITKSGNQVVDLSAGQNISWTNLNRYYGGNDNHLYFYYTRNKYDIVYNDGVFVDGSGHPVEGAVNRGELTDLKETGVAYQSNISGKDKNAEYEGYVFLGWYANKECAGDEFDFNTTMPANNITLYAKWGLPEYTVKLHANDSTSDPIKYNSETRSTEFWIDDGEKVGNVGGERIYYDLVGWYTDEALTHPFDFNSFVVNQQMVGKYGKLYSADEIDPAYPTTIGELNLYAKWRGKLVGANGINVVYVDGEHGKPTPDVNDDNNYVDGSHANAHGAFEPADKNNYVFSHWEVQKWDGSAYVPSGVNVFPGEAFEIKSADAKITDAEGNVYTIEDLDKDGAYTYTIQIKAVYIEKDKEIKTFINWYNNYDGGKVATSENIKINEATPIPDAPTRTGYNFLGWIRGIEEDGTTTTLTDLWLEYKDGGYVYNGNPATQVAADEVLVGDGTQHHALYAKWEPIDVDYTVEFYYQNDSGEGYTKDESLTATRQAKTDSTVEATTEDKGQTKDGKYVLVSGEPSVLSAKVKGDGTTVLKLYFNINKVDVTVEHYLKGQETAFKTDTVKDQSVGASYSATPETTYQEKNLTVNSYDPSQAITVKTTGNVIKIYYTLPLTITAKTDSKTYDGKPLDGEYTVEGALNEDDNTAILTALGTAPSITNVSESPENYLTEEDQAKITGIPSYYAVTYEEGTLKINPKEVTLTSGDATKPYDGTALTNADVKGKNANGLTVESGWVDGEGAAYTFSGSQTPVGNSKNTFDYVLNDNTKAENYKITKTEGTLTVTASDADITVVPGSGEKIYDGTALTKTAHDDFTVTGVPEGFTWEATADGTVTNVKPGEGEKAVNAVTSFKILDKDGNDVTDQFENIDKSATGTLKINPKEVTLTSGDASKVYDDSALTNADVKNKNTNGLTVETGWVDGEGATYTFTGTQTLVGSSANKFEYKLNDNTKSDNYTINKTEGTLTVTDKDVPDDKVVNKTDGKDNDGKKYHVGDTVEWTITVKNIYAVEKTLTVTEQEGVEIVGEVPEKLSAGQTAEIKATHVITAADVETGTYTNNVEVTLGDLEKHDDDTVETEPIEIEITADSNSKVYDAAPLTDDGWKQTAGTLAEGNTIDSVKVTGSQTLVGSSANVPSDAKIVDAAGEDVTKGYKITYKPGTLTVSDGTNPGEDPVDPELVVTKTDENTGKKYHVGDTVTWKIWVKNIYDEEKTLTITEKLEGVTLSEYPETLSAGQEVEITATYVVTAKDIESGKIKNEVTAKLDDFEKPGDNTVETEPIEIEITANSNSKVYDATPLTDDGWKQTKGTLAEGNEIDSVTVTGSQTLVGSSANVPSDAKIVDAAGEDVTAGYKITYVNGTLTVTDGTNPGEDPVDPKLVVTKTDENTGKTYHVGDTVTWKIWVKNIYDEEKTLTVTEKLANVTLSEYPETLAAGQEFEITATHVVTAEEAAAGTVKNEVDVKIGNLTKPGENEVKTEKIKITITADSDTKTYDGTALTKDTYTLSDGELAAGDEIKSVTVTGSQQDAGKSDNIPSEAKIVNAAGENVTDGYEITYTNGTLEVTPKNVTMTSATDEKYYDGTPLTNDEVTAEGFVDGEGAAYDVTGSQKLPGTSENTFTYTLNEGTKAVNYIVETVFGNLTVKDREDPDPENPDPTKDKYQVVVKANSDVVDYNGKEQTVSGFKSEDGVSYDADKDVLTYKNDKGVVFTIEGLSASTTETNAGTYDVKVNGEAKVYDEDHNDVTKQFTVKTVDGTFVINKLKLELISATDQKVYDGTALTNHNVTRNGELAPTDEIKYNVTGSQTYVGSSENLFTYEITAKTGVLTSAVNAVESYFVAYAEDETGNYPADNYEVTVKYGTLTVTDKGVDNDKVVTKTHEDKTYAVGDIVEFKVSATNIYDEAKTITLVEIPGVELATSVFADVAPGATVTTTAYHTITEADAEAGTFENIIKAKFSGETTEFENNDIVDDIEEPEEEEDVSNGPKTGDDNNFTGWLALMALAAAGGSGLIVKRRREDEE